MTLLALTDLDPAFHTSFSFYALLPGQGHQVAGAPAASEAFERAERLLASDLVHAPESDLDGFVALLLTHGSQLLADERFRMLADETARAFARLLGSELHRSRRMRLTRISLMLRVILDQNVDSSGFVSASIVPAKSPWDLLMETSSRSDGYIVSCDDDNVRSFCESQVRWSMRAGLPTQLDRLGEDVWIGSHYTRGGQIVKLAHPSRPFLLTIEHSAPLVLAFEMGTERWVLDAAGGLWLLRGTSIAHKLMQLPGIVHRARVVGPTLYAFDWSNAGTCIAIDLPRLRADSMATGDIIVCNDVCGHDGMLYGICKLQGRVFKMTNEWKPLSTRLGAGDGPAQLLDPIMIRSEGDHLHVLNWFSGKLVKLQLF